MAAGLPVLRTRKLSGSKSLVLLSSKCTFSGMFIKTTKRHPVLVSLIAMGTPFTISRVVERQHEHVEGFILTSD